MQQDSPPILLATSFPSAASVEFILWNVCTNCRYSSSSCACICANCSDDQDNIGSDARTSYERGRIASADKGDADDRRSNVVSGGIVVTTKLLRNPVAMFMDVVFVRPSHRRKTGV